jgi:Tol biopolymer transport system component
MLSRQFVILSGVLTVCGVSPASAQSSINAPLGPGRDVVEFVITGDGQRAIFRADPGNDEVFELFTSTIDGLTTSLRLHSALPSGRRVFDFFLAPDSSRAVYVANPVSSGKLELFSVPVDGSQAPVRLNGPFMVVNGGIHTIALYDERIVAISPDSSRVAFVASMDVSAAQADVYSAPLDGSAPAIKLNPTLGLIGDKSVSITAHVRISADSARVVYQADQDTGDVMELYSAPMDGSGPAVKLNGTLVAAGDVVTDAFAISSDSTRVVYLADQDTDLVNELYSSLLDGSGGMVKLNGSLVAGGEVFREFAITPDGSRVIYRADEQAEGAVQLFSVPADGSQPPIAIGGSGITGRTVLHFTISPDGSRVAYCADEQAEKVYEVYCVAVDGSSSTVDLGGAFPPDADAFPLMRFTQDGTRLLYVADANDNQRFDLYIVPVDGSISPVRLNSGQGFTDIRAVQVTPDDSRTILLADAERDEVPELYQIALGGGPMQKLALSLPIGREALSSFVVRNDAVFYLADQVQDNVFELFKSFRPTQHTGHNAGASSPGRTIFRSL